MLLGPHMMDSHGPQTILATYHHKLDGVTFPEVVKLQLLEVAAVKVYLLAFSGADVAKSLLMEDSYNLTLHRQPRFALSRVVAVDRNQWAERLQDELVGRGAESLPTNFSS